MKKHLIAAAVAAAVSVPAMAQNVSVYGVIDTAIQRHDSGNQSVTRAQDGVISTSRLGFRGTEDLGGGLKGIFTLEARLNPSAGTMPADFNRGAWVGLEGGFGTIRVGQGDTTNTQDIDSKVTQAGNLGLRVSLGKSDTSTWAPTAAGTNTETTAASIYSNGGELGADVANVIRYTSPVFSGFQFELGYATNSSTATTDANGDVQDLYVQYENGPLGVYAGYAKKDGATKVAETDFRAIGAKYNFGSFSVGATYARADISTTAEQDLKTTVISAAVPFGNGLTGHIVYGAAELENSTGNKGSGYTIALTKALSKRTLVYGAYTDTNSDSNARFSMTGVSVGKAVENGNDPSAFTVGVSHSF